MSVSMNNNCQSNSSLKNSQMSTNRELYYANALIKEIKNENLENVKQLLLVKKADPNLWFPGSGISAMHLMAGMENEYFTVEVIHLALKECDGNPNTRSEEGLTPVHLAAMWGRCKVLELLLNFGGDPDLVEYKMGLDAEDLALREHQWHAYGILAAFAIMKDNDTDIHPASNSNVCKENDSESDCKYSDSSMKCRSKYILNGTSFTDHNDCLPIDKINRTEERTKSTQTNFNKHGVFNSKENSDNPSEKSSLKSASKSLNKTKKRISEFFRSLFV